MYCTPNRSMSECPSTITTRTRQWKSINWDAARITSDHLFTGISSGAVRRSVYSHLSAETARLVVNLRTHLDANVGWSARAETSNKEYDCIVYQLSPHTYTPLLSSLPTISLVYIIAALSRSPLLSRSGVPLPHYPTPFHTGRSPFVNCHQSSEQKLHIIAVSRPNTWSPPHQVQRIFSTSSLSTLHLARPLYV